MRKNLLLAMLALPALAWAQATTDTKVESTTKTPSKTDSSMTEKTVKQKSDGSSSTTVEHKAKHDPAGAKTTTTHTKSTVEKDPAGNVTKSETTSDKK